MTSSLFTRLLFVNPQDVVCESNYSKKISYRGRHPEDVQVRGSALVLHNEPNRSFLIANRKSPRLQHRKRSGCDGQRRAVFPIVIQADSEHH